jgi:antirestriction protein
MLIKEFPAVYKDGKKIVNETETIKLIANFCNQLEERGKTSFNFFVDKEKINDENDENSEYPTGIVVSSDFNSEDLLMLILSYLDSNMDLKGKLAFAAQLQNILLNDVISSGEGEEEAY